MKTLLLSLSFFACIMINATPPSIGGYNVYYGHLHNHTNYSDGGGTPNSAYNYAKNTAKLDFFGLSDHDTNIDSLEWVDTKAQADAINQDGVFTTFYGFEWSYYGNYGHVTVVGTPDYTTVIATNTFEKLKTWLSTRDGIAFFNHPGREDANGKEFDHFTGKPSDKFVGIELWNKGEGFSSFYYNDGYTANDNTKGFYEEALGLGWKIGASGAADNHFATWGTSEDYRMAILSNNLTRNDLWQAMQARRFYSTMDKNLALSFKINNQEMGSTLIPGTYTVQVQASDGDGEVFTNVKLYDKAHNVIQEWTPNSPIVNVSANLTTANGDFYYVKVTEADGGEAVSSPIWIEAADTQAPIAFTATKGAVTATSVELLLNATDNSGAVNYTISYGTVPTIVTVTGVSATLKSYIVTGLTPATSYTFSVTAKDAANNAAVNNPIGVTATTSALSPALIVTSSPSVPAPYLLANLTDGNTTTNWKVMSAHTSYITFEYASAKIFNKVVLTSTIDDAPSRDPKNWTIKASNDTLAGWTVLNTQTNQTFATRGSSKPYSFVNNTAYKFYRLHITESYYSTSSTMLAEIAFSGDTIPPTDTQVPTAFAATKGAITSNSVELLLNATDNSGAINYTISYGTIPTIVTVSGISATQKSYIITGLTPVTAYTFSVTAKDAANNAATNNPIAILATTSTVADTIAPTAFTATKGAVTATSVELLLNATDNSGTVNYTISYGTIPTIVTVSGISATQKSYIIPGLTPATAYTFSVTAKDAANNAATNNPIAILATTSAVADTIAPTAFTALKGAVTATSVELLLNATDNSGAINYTISYGTIPTIITVVGVSAAQKSYIVTGLTSATAYTFSITAKDAANNAAANNPIAISATTSAVAQALMVTSSPSVPPPYSVNYLTDGNTATNWKVMSAHASYITFEYSSAKTFNKVVLTSTIDDAPSRDPKNWTIKASNDTLAGWTVLDTRTNQTFATRGLAKTYSFTNNTAYKFYRLHITESYYSTSATMLAELSFSGDTIVTDTQAPTAFTAVKGAITSNSVELLLNATDNSGTVNYTISYGTVPTIINVAGISAAQKSYIITGLTPATAYIFSVTAKDAANNVAANNPIGVTATTLAVADTIAPTAFTATKGAVTATSVELLLNATDNSGAINYSISYGTIPTIINVAGISAAQKSYIITGLTPATAYTFSVTAKDAANNAAVNNPIVVSATTSAVADTIAPTAFAATKGAITSNSVELLLNATDNSGTVNYTISYGTVPTIVTVSGVSATQKSYIITGLTPATAYTFFVTAKDAANNAAANNPIVVSATTSAVADTIAPTAFTTTKGAVTTTSVELLLNATDNSGAINYTISYGTIPTIINVAGISAAQKSYIITGLTPATTYTFSVTAKDAANNAAANNPIVVSATTSAVADTIAPTAFAATKGAITSNSVELLLNATDNSGTVNYTISYGTVPTIVTVTGVSATVKSYIINGLTPATAYTFSITAKDAANNAAVNNPIGVTTNTSALSPALIVTSSPKVAAPYSLANLTDGNTTTNWKVMSAHASYITFEYASAKTFNKVVLTSTIDDAPSRDPKNWTIKASNDTLTGWTVLNTQTNQTFATRGLSKTYSFVNNTAYRFYRLHITESYYSTTSTMLAEIAFLGDTIAAPANAKQFTVNDTASIIIESEKISSATNGQITIYSSNRTLFIKNTSDRNGDLYLFDIYGRLILKQPFSGNNSTSISLNLPAGVYVAIGITLNEKVIKNLILP